MSSFSLPPVIQDEIPTGLEYLAGSAQATLPSGSSVKIQYSIDHGVSWTTTPPSPASAVTNLQWWLDRDLAGGQTFAVSFQAKLPNPATPIIVDNCGGVSLGNNDPVDTDCQTTLVKVPGTLTIGDTVFLDSGAGGGTRGNGIQDGSEPGIANMGVKLYLDVNTNGALDVNDLLLDSKSTDATGKYSFAQLPAGYYLVQVDLSDPDLPAGAGLTTDEVKPIHLVAGNDLTADFGFTPALSLDKNLVGASPIYEGDLVSYTIDLHNNLKVLPGTPRVYALWGTSVHSTDPGEFTNPANAAKPSEPEGSVATDVLAGSTNKALRIGGFDLLASASSITKVEMLVRVMVNAGHNDDGLDVITLDNAGNLVTRTLAITGAQLQTATSLTTFAVDVTADGWAFSDFTARSTNTYAAVKTNKLHGGDGTTLSVDAIGYRITTDAVDYGSGTYDVNRTLDPVPLRDTYDTDALEFVSASISPDSTSPAGTLTWNDVGPINAGTTKQILVTFRAKEPAGNVQDTSVRNTGTTTNAKFANGLSANTATDYVDVVLNPTAKIGDYVWVNPDGDAIKDPGEPGIPGVTVRLLDSGGTNVLTTTVTDATGFYEFSAVRNGTYIVRVDPTTLPGTFNQNYDSDGSNGVSGNQSTVTIANAASNYLQDFGYTTANNLVFGKIWEDVNDDGSPTQQAGEPGLNTVQVQLRSTGADGLVGTADDSTLATTTTTNGAYQFTNVASSTTTRYVRVITGTGDLPGTWTQTVDADSPFSLDNQKTVPFLLSNGTISGSHNFAYHNATGTLTVGDYVFYDMDGDGTHDGPANEPGIPNITVRLYRDTDNDGIYDSATDPLVATTSTSAGGMYQFSGLSNGNYLALADETDPQFPSSVDRTTGNPLDADLAGTSRTDVDFGYQPLQSGSIGDTVWRDNDGDGQQSSLEPGIASITVSLYQDLDGDGTYAPMRTTTTDADGKYLFDNLPNGNYRVIVNTADTDLPKDSQLVPYTPTTAATLNRTIAGGADIPDADFGFAPLGMIGDLVWYDANSNAEPDYNESGIPGVQIQLRIDTNGDGVGDTAALYVNGSAIPNQTTDANGAYLFTAVPPLPAGQYYIAEVVTGTLPAGVIATGDPDRDGVPANVPPPNPPAIPPPPANNRDENIIISYGTDYRGADFGYKPTGVVGDFVWLDQNNNGLQEAGELGISGVGVSITKGGTTYNTTTDADGLYSFQGLTAGTWTVTITPPTLAGVTLSPSTYNLAAALATGNGNLAGDATPHVATVTIDAAGNVTQIDGSPVTDATHGELNLDFGYRFNGTRNISGTIALEEKGTENGQTTDATDLRLPGQTVNLWQVIGATNVYMGSTTTDVNGHYSFNSLRDGNYVVSMATMAPLFANTQLTTADLGGVDTNATAVIRTPASGTLTSVRETLTLNSTTASTDPGGTDPNTLERIDFAYVSTVNYDFGDLPQSYSTLLTGNPDGPRHVVPASPTLYLGASVDTEPNGVPSTLANGDDAAGSDDEDGVTIVNPSAWTADSTTAQVSVIVHGSGWLVAWMDFDEDGSFVDSDEVVINQAVTTGTSTVTFAIPVSATADLTSGIYSRFRLFDTQPLVPQTAFTGVAGAGEVEDYRLCAVDLQLAKSFLPIANGDGMFGDGDTVRFTLLVQNVSGADATHVVVQDIVPAGYALTVPSDVTFPGAPGSNLQGVVNVSARTITWTIPTVAAHDLVSFYYQTQIDSGHAPADYQNRAEIMSQDQFDIDSIPGNGSITEDDDAQVSPNLVDLELDKSVNNPTSNIGDTVIFTVNLSNNGPLAAANVQVKDVVPDGFTNLSNISISPSMGSAVQSPAGTITWTIGSLPVGGPWALTFTAVVVANQTAPADYTNLAQAISLDSNYFDLDSTPNNGVDTDGDGNVADDSGDEDDGDGVVVVPKGAISGFVYVDADNDGVKDPAETGISGVTVTLTGTDDLGVPVNVPGTTGVGGAYSFANLRPGTYTLTETQPGTYLDGKDTIGTPGGTAGNDVFSNIVLTAGTAGANNNFGELQAATVSGYVYLDADNDGVKDQGETPLSGVTVTLSGTNDQGAITPVVLTTGVDGSYSFVNVRPGTYTVTETQPGTYLDGLDAKNNVPIGGSATTDAVTTITVASGGTAANNNFGELQPSSLAGFVYVDANNDGSKGVGESGISGATVTLTGSNDLGAITPLPVTTGADGSYSLANLRPGTYTLTETQPGAYLDGTDTIGTPGGTAGNDTFSSIALGQNVSGANNNFGELQAATVSGYVYLDADNDGVKDAGETPLSGVTVTLSGTNDQGAITPAVLTTGVDGSYSFGNLRPGTYTVTETQPSGRLDGLDALNNVPLAGSATTDAVTTITVVSGGTAANNNFGELQPSSLAGYVYVDANNDGSKGGGESGISGATVTLTGSNDLGPVTQVFEVAHFHGPHRPRPVDAGLASRRRPFPGSPVPTSPPCRRLRRRQGGEAETGGVLRTSA